jgi:hypothetical protein
MVSRSSHVCYISRPSHPRHDHHISVWAYVNYEDSHQSLVSSAALGPKDLITLLIINIKEEWKGREMT